jgi:hypothetical protein
MKTIIDNIRRDAAEAAMYFIRNSMPSAKIIDVEVCWDLSTINYTWDYTYHRVASGLEKEFIAKLGLVVCKKREAMCYMIAGEKQDGMFDRRKSNVYWLKPKTS